jgi:hypothetical protein
MAADDPELLGDILGRIFTSRGWGRRQERLRLEQAWSEAMETCGLAPSQARPGSLRRGVLEVMVGNSIVLQELAHFHKRGLLEQLRRRLPGVALTDLRFRAGVL